MVIIGNLDNPIAKMTKEEVQNIFMGRTRAFPNGNFVLPLDLSEARTEFYLKLTNRPIEQINAYWARIMFSGQASPPMTLPSEELLLKTIAENKGAIGYIEKKKANEKHVHILLILD